MFFWAFTLDLGTDFCKEPAERFPYPAAGELGDAFNTDIRALAGKLAYDNAPESTDPLLLKAAELYMGYAVQMPRIEDEVESELTQT